MPILMNTVNVLPQDLPVPQDDGAAKHLLGRKIPSITLPATRGPMINLGGIKAKLVIYCYPRTGQPDEPPPKAWDQIPGARGCTPQSCSFRDHYSEIQALGAEVVGLSVQTTDYQKEMADRLHLPFPVLSDHLYAFQKALDLPVFEFAGMTLLKRVTLIAHEGLIVAVHYPVFPSDSDPLWVIEQLRRI
jgi:peroxiredoxin